MTEASNRLIRLEGISKVYQAELVDTHALSSVDLEVQEGEYIAITGPSGCGKTTLLSILGLLDTPSSGRYLLEDRAVEGLSSTERARVRRHHIGFIFQNFNLIGGLSVEENVELPLLYQGMGRDERRDQVDAALERVAMEHRKRHMPSQLSGGQQQRVAVARAVVGTPLILLADEPTGNLDSANGEEVLKLLADLHEAGSTLCVVTHDPRHAERAERTVELLDGRIMS